MKTKKCDWVLEISRVSEDNRFVIEYIAVFDSTKEEVVEYAKTLVGTIFVRVYKFAIAL